MRKRLITLSGLPGSGKSSTADRVAELLHYRRFSSGDFMRAIASKHNVTVDEVNRLAEDDAEIDHEVDDMVRKTGERDDIVIDSRLAFYWLPQSFKVFLKIDPKIAAERTFKAIKEVGRVRQEAESVEEVYEKLVERVESERKRYRALYDVDYTEVSEFDLVIDTAQYSLEEVARRIVEK